MSKVSVIIPVYNVEKYIAQSLESVINQTYKDIEILCIDDCGNDNSMQIVENFAKKDSRIKIIHHNKNMGLGIARNTGVKHAKGKYIACVDSDDWIDVTMFEKCCNILEETNLDSVWVKVNTYIEEEDRYTTDNYYKGLFEQKGGYIDITPDNINTFPVNAWNKVYKTDFIRQNNINWSEGLLYEDLEFYYKFYTKSHKTFLIDEMLYFYRWRTSSIMNQTDRGNCRCEDIYDVSLNIYKYLENENLLQKYEQSYLKIVERNILLYLYNPHYQTRVVDAAKKLLSEINYPEKYNSNYRIKLLDKIKNFDFNKKQNKFILLLINLIPIKNLRKKLRNKYREEYII